MREILFRGKQLDNGGWIFGYLVEDIDGSQPIIVDRAFMEDNNSIWFEYGHIDRATIGQYTGLKDKNGKRIFEGDVVQFDNGRFVVEYYDCRMGFAFSGLFGRGCVSGFTMTDWEHLEVIGNIHDNPELLKKEEEK